MLLIFDCDGTLIDSERILNEVFRQCLIDVGVEMSFDEVIAQFQGYSITYCLNKAEGMFNLSFDKQYVSQKYEELGAQALRESIRPIPGVAEALNLLPHRRCVASGSSHEHIRLGLSGAGIFHHFEGSIFSASDVERGKPEPDLFLHAASEMGVEPAQCVVVEDTTAGVKAAVAAGMKVLGFADLTPESDLSELGAHTFTSMEQLPHLLDRLN